MSQYTQWSATESATTTPGAPPPAPPSFLSQLFLQPFQNSIDFTAAYPAPMFENNITEIQLRLSTAPDFAVVLDTQTFSVPGFVAVGDEEVGGSFTGLQPATQYYAQVREKIG